MNKWITRTGYALIVIALLQLPPLSDYLPIDFWRQLSQMFSSDTPAGYYKPVPDNGSDIWLYVLLVAGVVIVGFEKWFCRMKKDE
jgi:hypothetical protein